MLFGLLLALPGSQARMLGLNGEEVTASAGAVAGNCSDMASGRELSGGGDGAWASLGWPIATFILVIILVWRKSRDPNFLSFRLQLHI